MAGKPKPLGPASLRLAANVRRFRLARRMTTNALSGHVSDDLGTPVLPTGITKLEAGQRRSDPDEVMALAIALGVSPNALLLPAVNHAAFGFSEAFLLAPRFPGHAGPAWRWACGDAPLDESDEAEFIVQNHPQSFGAQLMLPRGVQEAWGALRGAIAAAMDAGTPTWLIRTAVDQALVETLLARRNDQGQS